ncbi:TniQ family protein [Bacillus sp. SJS]|uniref:TniQ family protein n=1 Tax=Bacillus sp. SJS TaxID=1423321 RepID=UPI0004DD3405|nr:TniQ family protein [Bacillus sp. SJS]KZZ84849.1 hypothetical protein AS29_007245 [Bacillus sp. SJS]
MNNIPERSYLYHLPPIGNGTKNIESLTSYVTRLSSAHLISLGVFFTKIIYVSLQKDSIPRDGITAAKTSSFNNFHQNAKDLVFTLESLTLVKGLDQLTLINFSKCLSSFNDVRSKKYWCPDCFEKWKTNGEEVYEKLIWVFKIVEICELHNKRLICNCPNCNAYQYHIHRSGQMGKCYKCGNWLGASRVENNDKLESIEYVKWQNWIINNIYQLIVLKSEERNIINMSAVNFQYYIRDLLINIKEKFGISKMELSKSCLIPCRILMYWENGTQRASLHSLLKLCFILNKSLIDIFSGNTTIYTDTLNELPTSLKEINNNRSLKRYEDNVLKTLLEQILMDKVNPPPSLSYVTKKLGYTKSETLKEKFPQETQEIVKNHKKYLSEKSRSKKEEIKSIIIDLVNKDEYPSQKKISEALNKTNSFFWKKDNRETLNEICKELKVERRNTNPNN